MQMRKRMMRRKCGGRNAYGFLLNYCELVEIYIQIMHSADKYIIVTHF